MRMLKGREKPSRHRRQSERTDSNQRKEGALKTHFVARSEILTSSLWLSTTWP